MNRIDARFRLLRRSGQKAFIAYLTGGDLSLEVTRRSILALERSGVDIVEIGVPFSDPVADGPTIQAASNRALARGVTVSAIFSMVRRLRRSSDIPVALMTYYNPVFRFGISSFFKASARSGVDGIIIPDLPREEASEVIRLGRAHRIATVFLVAPTSGRERMKAIARVSTGFLYYVSLAGVTGVRVRLPSDVVTNVRYLQSLTKKPVAVGFGIATPAQAREIAAVADGVIVGSALVKLFEGGRKGLIPRISGFARGIAKAVHHA